MSEYNPFAAPDVNLDSQFQPEGREYGGLRRLPYFGYGFLINLVIQGIQAAGAAAESAPIVLATVPVGLVAMVALGYQRCKNIGMNPWWSLGLLVPFVNIFVGLRVWRFRKVIRIIGLWMDRQRF
jgi:uncharacterized membrane protein YhaH (DUF805 family)